MNTETSMTQRPAADADLEALFAIHELVFKDHIESIWGWDAGWQRRRFVDEMERSRTRVVEIGGETAGYTQTVVRPDEFYLQNMALKPAYQGGGIGARLVKELQDEAEEKAVPVTLRVFRKNHRARSFYMRLGFVETDRSEAFVSMTWVSD